jgi:hypothetical protein
MKKLSSSSSNVQSHLLSANFWRRAGFVTLVGTVTGVFLGFAVMFIIQGSFFFALRLSTFWEPAHKFLGKLSLTSSDKLDKWGWWKWIFIFLISLPELLLATAGIWILYTLGFERQNFIFLLFFK